MTRRLATVVLIDDEEADNFWHRRVIEQSGVAEAVVVFDDARTALAYLMTPIDGQCPEPDLILLDVNMPGMNGWEFLTAYAELPALQRSGIVVEVLSTSANPADQQRAGGFASVAGFRPKPLSAEMLHDILAAHFDG